MKRKCPGCGQLLTDLKTDWTLKELKRNEHQIATIGTNHNAPEDLKDTVGFQIASNLAAYQLDYDYQINFGMLGEGFVQCPEVRPKITDICIVA